MIDLVYQKLSDTQFVASVLVGVAAAATAFTVAQPLLEGDSLGRRSRSWSASSSTTGSARKQPRGSS